MSAGYTCIKGTRCALICGDTRRICLVSSLPASQPLRTQDIHLVVGTESPTVRIPRSQPRGAPRRVSCMQMQRRTSLTDLRHSAAIITPSSRYQTPTSNYHPLEGRYYWPRHSCFIHTSGLSDSHTARLGLPSLTRWILRNRERHPKEFTDPLL